MIKNFIFVLKGIVMSQPFSAVLFLLFFSLMATAQNIVFTDAQFEVKLLEASSTNNIALDENNNSIIIDMNNDGIIQESEALPVIKLNVSDSAITSLNGIEFFQNLTELNCTMNHLTTLILPELPNLTFLECRLNQLEVLDLSLTENLMTLTADLNNLHTIVFHPNAQLNYINLGYNNLVALDVSGLSQLSDLLIHHNSLELLNVTGLVNLNSLNCRDNHLTALDLSGLSGLAIVFCQNNQLTNIELNGLSNLMGLECQDNQLVQMDVSDSPILEYVFVENNNLVELNLKNGANESASFNGNPDLSYICCDEEQIEAIEFLLVDWNIPNCTVDANCTLNTDRFTLSDRLIISPNPVQHAFSIQITDVILNVSVQDLNGRVIASYGANQTNSYPVNTANGVYLVKIITTDSIYTQKIVKH